MLPHIFLIVCVSLLWKKGTLQPLWKTVWSFLKKLKIARLYDPAIPLLNIYLKKTKPLI